ncbi:Vacuolar protein-sorting-associated protein 27, partial [Physocladia obscura]
KATSENLPVGAEDMFVSLDIVDKIKSKQTPAKYAVSVIKRRLTHKNPNVQLLAIKLLDTCAKNSGSHFLVEVATRDFMDSLVAIGGALNMATLDVRKAALALIQTWGLSFKGKPELSYACEVYESLKREGVPFPAVEQAEVSSIMVDTTTAPAWTESDTSPLPQLGITDAVRVCDGCYLKLVAKAAGATTTSANASKNSGRNTPQRNDSRQAADTALRKEQEDIERAIAASLTASGSVTKNTQPNPKPVVDEEEDEDLKAAIEASLRDLKLNEEKSAPGVHYPSVNVGGSTFSGFGGNTESTAPATGNASAGDSNELSNIEIDNLKVFADLVERMDADVQQRGIGVMSHSQISLFALQPKLQSSLDNAVSKYRESMDMNEKVANALQMYDRMLQDRLIARGASIYGPPPTQQHWTQPQGYYTPQQPFQIPQGAPQTYIQPQQSFQSQQIPFQGTQPQQAWAGYSENTSYVSSSEQHDHAVYPQNQTQDATYQQQPLPPANFVAAQQPTNFLPAVASYPANSSGYAASPPNLAYQQQQQFPQDAYAPSINTGDQQQQQPTQDSYAPSSAPTQQGFGYNSLQGLQFSQDPQSQNLPGQTSQIPQHQPVLQQNSQVYSHDPQYTYGSPPPHQQGGQSQHDAGGYFNQQTQAHPQSQNILPTQEAPLIEF